MMSEFNHLNAHGCYQGRHTDSLWEHESLPISFTLVVDDFGKHEPVHLITTLEKQHDISVDWSGSKCLGLALAWDYAQRHITFQC